MDKCPALEKVNIHLSPSTASRNADDTMQEFETDNSLKQEYVQRMILMGKEVCHVKSLTLFVHLSKGNSYCIMILSMLKLKLWSSTRTGEEQLLFALPMVQDFEVHLLAYIIPEMASKKCSILSSQVLEIKMEAQASSKNIKIRIRFRIDSLTTIIHHILSVMDTKCMVQTCVLSKKWRYHRKNVHALNFDRSSFANWSALAYFVTNVLHHHNSQALPQSGQTQDLNLVKLKFYCSDGELDSIDAIIETLTNIVFEYAISHRFKELKTDIVDNFPATLFECQTLKTLKLGQTTKCLRDLHGFATLTTLQLSSVIIDLENDMFFGCLNLENLLLIECTLLADPVQVVMGDYTISAPRLVNLQISDFLYRGRLVINGPRLKFF
ncbi:hypothetical protein EZV62_020898 [Acer yangbiense]|uniref:F-box domain-containing protein n=1 Tax=Acer yangbiense TaxID=1000413 RepID=A0A5C7HGZ6_9ROSI|nr:hypothetical protein EZV62_020898 [Acer yangbiense]